MPQHIVPPRIAGLLFSIFMALTMSVPMSLVMLVANGGLALEVGAFAVRWLQSALIGFLVALPISSVAVPRIRHLVDRLTGEVRD